MGFIVTDSGPPQAGVIPEAGTGEGGGGGGLAAPSVLVGNLLQGDEPQHCLVR